MDTSTQTQKLFGVVKTLKLERGFFFITSYFGDGGTAVDVFCHVSQIMPGFPVPNVFDRVMFGLAIDSKTGRQMGIECETYPGIMPQAGV